MIQINEKAAGAATPTAHNDDPTPTYEPNRDTQSTASGRIVRLTIPNKQQPGRPLIAVMYADGSARLSLGSDPITAADIRLAASDVRELARLFGGDPQ